MSRLSSPPASLERQWFLPRDLLWVFILNGALECGFYLHFIEISVTEPSQWSTSQEKEPEEGSGKPAPSCNLEI